MKNPTAKQEPQLNAVAVQEQRQELLKLKAQIADDAVKRMIDLAVEGLEAGVPRLSAEEISEYLGRDR